MKVLMKNILYLPLLLILVLSVDKSHAQNITGRITDKENNPLVASIHINSENIGVVSNKDGYYQLFLHEGNYQIEYIYPDYKTVVKEIQVRDSTISLQMDIRLEEENFRIMHLLTNQQKEEKGRDIISSYMEEVKRQDERYKQFVVETYAKGNIDVSNIPTILKKVVSEDLKAKLSVINDHTFVLEAINEIEYDSQNVKQTMEALDGNIPNQVDIINTITDFLKDVYSSRDNIFSSIFSQGAFSYYKFVYTGSIENSQGEKISRIHIIPQFRDISLFRGYIYINESTNNVDIVDLSNLLVNIRITWLRKDDNNYLPATIVVKTSKNIMGLELKVDMFSSFRYSSILINDHKETENEKHRNTSYKVIINRDLIEKNNSDTTFWDRNRRIPLTCLEKKEFLQKDVVLQPFLSASPRKKPFILRALGNHEFCIDSCETKIKLDGLALAVEEYNYVDGFWIGQEALLTTKMNRKYLLTVNPYIYYLTARHRFVGGATTLFNYAPYNNGVINLTFGSKSEDFNPMGNRDGNSLSSLLWGSNYTYFYQKDFVNISNEINVIDGLRLRVGFEIARRDGLSNNTEYSILYKNRTKRPNIYSDERFDCTLYNLGFEYTPVQKSYIRNGIKYYDIARFPTLFFDYHEAFSRWQKDNSRYRKLSGGMYQDIRIDLFNSMDYSIEYGRFVGNKKNVHFSDYHHFSASDTYVSKSPFDSYLLLDSYAASTNDYWINTRLNYKSQYLLLKRIPFFQGIPFTESLHFKWLYTPEKKFYSEFGYSVNATKHINFGLFFSYNDGKFAKTALRFSYNFGAFRASLRQR